MLDSQCEIIPIFDVIDELSSCSFQVRWSYLPMEIKWNEVFVPVVSRSEEGPIQYDCLRLSETRPDPDAIKVKQKDELDYSELVKLNKEESESD